MDQEIRKDLATPAPGISGFRAAVIVPPVCDFYFTPHRFSCLGARVVCNILSEYGIQHVFLNFPLIKKKSQNIGIPEEINYLKDYINPREFGKLSYFTKYQRFGPGSKECAKIVTDSCPSICFISCFAFSYAKESIDLAEDIKKIRPDLPIVIGGAGVSAYPFYFIKERHVDFAITGEAEISLKPFLDAMLEKGLEFKEVPNLYWKRTHSIVSNMHTTRFTSQNEIMPVISKVFERKNRAYFSVSLTRGCDKKCRFCSNFLSHGQGFRIASFKSVSLMIDRLSIDRKSNFIVNFEDDNLLYAPEYLLRVMNLFREKLGDVTFLAENGIDYNLLSPLFADELIEVGMSKFNFTLGSINYNVLKAQGRKGSKTHFESIVRHIASKGIPVLSYFICGLKGDTNESVAEILTYLYSLPTQVGISLFYAVPGLPDFADLGLFDTFSPLRCNGTSAFPWYGNEGLTTMELVTAFRLSRYINLLKSDIKSEIELQLIEKIKKAKKLLTPTKIKNEIEIVPARGTDDQMVKSVFEKIEEPRPF
jgi:anaerobic magnesium-protoporphyrin IX monomethyl ester cyclase